MKRMVLDTNVSISAFFWRGYSRAVYDLVREGKVTLLSSMKIEAEFIDVSFNGLCEINKFGGSR